MIEIDKKELCRLKKAKKIRRVFCLPMLWVMLITYSLVGNSLILYGIFSMPELVQKIYYWESGGGHNALFCNRNSHHTLIFYDS